MVTIFDEFEGQVVPLGIHMYWPGSQDSFYLYDSTDALARRQYYGFNYVPTFRMDGDSLGDPSDFATYDQWYAFVRATLDSLLEIPSPIRINLNQFWSADTDSVYVSFDIVCVDAVEGNMRLFYGVAEYEHKYSLPRPYAKRWYHALRQFGSGPDGIPITLSPGDSLHYEWAYPIAGVYSQDDALVENDQWDMTTVVFVQRWGTRKIQQAASLRGSDVAGIWPGDVTTATVSVSQNAPNPFRSRTTIMYSLGKAGDVSLSVYSAEGRLVTRLVDTHLEPGTYSASWDGRDRFGSQVGSGMYYYKLDAGGEIRTGRMVFLK